MSKSKLDHTELKCVHEVCIGPQWVKEVKGRKRLLFFEKVALSLSMSLHHFVYQSIYPPTCLSVLPSVHPSIYLSACLSYCLCLSLCLIIYLCASISTFLTLTDRIHFCQCQFIIDLVSVK